MSKCKECRWDKICYIHLVEDTYKMENCKNFEEQTQYESKSELKRIDILKDLGITEDE